MAVKEQTHFDDLFLTGSLLVLTFSTGLVDAASFLALGHVLTANMTGNIVFTAFALAGVPGHSITRSALALLSALAGAAVAGHIDKKLVWKRRNAWLSASFAIEAIFLTFAFCVAWFTRGRPIQVSTVNSLIVLTAFGMGIRNGTVRRLAVPDLTTTVLTLTVVGLAFESFIAGGRKLALAEKSRVDRDDLYGSSHRSNAAAPFVSACSGRCRLADGVLFDRPASSQRNRA
jgi:uncharacterized membrane protein YoaK (UPF0700 family)